MNGSRDRRAMLAKVHVAKKQLGLADQDYRAGLERVTGKATAADCSDQQLAAVLDEFRRLGWKDAPGGRPRSANPQVRMIYAIWGEMRRSGEVQGDDAALRSFVKRQTKSLKNPAGVEAPEFLDAAEANKVIEGLKSWRTRLRQGEAE